jgi:hypothetical protein
MFKKILYGQHENMIFCYIQIYCSVLIVWVVRRWQAIQTLIY